MTLATVILVAGMLGIFLAVFVSLVAVGAFNNEARGVSKSLAVVEAFSAAPQAMQQELDPSFKDRVVLPSLERLVGLGRKFTPADYGDRVRRKLEVAGNPAGWTVDRLTAMKVVGFAGMAVLSLAFVLLPRAGIRAWLQSWSLVGRRRGLLLTRLVPVPEGRRSRRGDAEDVP